MSYLRVIPRDLFNEAKLLKCLGKLYIEAEKTTGIEIYQYGDPFQVEQDESDGSISVANIFVKVNGIEVYPSTSLNARQDWPMYVVHNDEEIDVFNDDGTLTDEFKAIGSDDSKEFDDYVKKGAPF